MRNASFLFAAFALAGCTTMSDPPAPLTVNEAAAYDRIALDLKSWGLPYSQWTLEADGRGTLTLREPETAPPVPPLTLATRDIAVGTVGMAKLSALARQIPRPYPDDQSCTNRMTDAVYGSLSLTRDGQTTEIPVYLGCFDEDYLPLATSVEALDALVHRWGGNAAVTSRRTIGN